MSRGQLEDSFMRTISKEIPDLRYLKELVYVPIPEFISFIFPPNSYVPIASVCFQNAYNNLVGASYALVECLANRVWYLTKNNPPDEINAIYFAKYYLDDAALRLYSAGEHLANGIIMMLDIKDKDLKPYKNKGKKERISQQSIIGNFLIAEKSNHPITGAINRLATSKEWHETIKYRNRWVHEQSPSIQGLGIVHTRKIRWTVSLDGKRVSMNGIGDLPEYSLEDLVGFIKPSIFNFTDVLTTISNLYLDLLKSHGFDTKVNHNTINWQINLREASILGNPPLQKKSE